MKKIPLWLCIIVVWAGSASAGTITGTVRGVAPTGGSEAGGGGAYDSRRYKFAEKIDYDRLRDFVIYIDQPVSEVTPGAPRLAAITTQKDASFEPHVLPVAVGTTVRWPNEDDIYHNVFSMSDAKQFDLGFYKKEKVPELKFDQVGRVDVFCAIHTKMHCIILVVPNSFFTLADAKGRFVLKDIPPGTYRLRAWHERLPSLVREVVVPAAGEVTVDFKLGLGELPKY
jgi:plastocyanin